MRRTAIALAALALALLPATALAQDCPRTSLGDIEDEVMCPICGTPLGLASEAPQAQDERAYIQRLIDRCESKDQIKRALVGQYGKNILALPGDQGSDDLGDVRKRTDRCAFAGLGDEPSRGLDFRPHGPCGEGVPGQVARRHGVEAPLLRRAPI